MLKEKNFIKVLKGKVILQLLKTYSRPYDVGDDHTNINKTI